MRWAWLGGPRPDGSFGDLEWCGILRGREARIVDVELTRNVSPSPQDSFEIEPAALVRAYRRQRAPNGLSVLGFFHTHPVGTAAPSERDARDAAPDGRLWLIASRNQGRLWRAVAGGRVHGRFDPVRFDIVAGKRVDKNIDAVQWRGAGQPITVTFEEPLR